MVSLQSPIRDAEMSSEASMSSANAQTHGDTCLAKGPNGMFQAKQRKKKKKKEGESKQAKRTRWSDTVGMGLLESCSMGNSWSS